MKIICKNEEEMNKIVSIFIDTDYCPEHFGGEGSLDLLCEPRKNQTQVEVCECCWQNSGLIEVIN